MATPEVRELLDGQVQLHFADDDGTLHDVDAAELAEALQGLVEFTGQMARTGLFGEGAPPRVRVRPPSSGSVTITTILHFAHENPEIATAMYVTAAGAVAQTLRVAVRLLRDEPVVDFEHLDNDMVKIEWKGGEAQEVPLKTWNELNAGKKRTRRALAKIMRPLGGDVTKLEVRSAGTEASPAEVTAAEPELVLDRADYAQAVVEEPDPEDEIQYFEVEAALLAVDFRRGEKWRIETRQGDRRRARSAHMEDEEFLLRLDRGLRLSKNDILRLRIREVSSVTKGRTSTEWTIVEVVSQRRGVGDGEGEESPRQPSE